MQPMMTAPARPRRIETAAEGAHLIAEPAALLGTLLKLEDEETALVRHGRLAEASRLEPRKSELASQYYAAMERLKGNAPFLRTNLPNELDALRRQHDMFRALLQINLTVLATAHAVSEGIV